MANKHENELNNLYNNLGVNQQDYCISYQYQSIAIAIFNTIYLIEETCSLLIATLSPSLR